MHKLIKVGLPFAVGTLAGFYLCILVKKVTILKLDPTVSFQINPFEIFSLITTIFLAIYVARTIAKANDLEKGEKDLLIKSLTEFKSEFSSKIDHLLEQSDLDSIITNSSFKLIRKKIDTIISLGYDYKFIEREDIQTNQLKDKIRDIWELFTDVPKKANGRSPAAVKSDIDRIRLEQVSKINMTAIEIEKQLFQLTMKIHRK